MKSVVAKVLTLLLSEYIEGIDSKKLDFSFFSKKAQLKDTVIRKNVFINQQIPFEVTKGVIGYLDLQLEELSKSLPMTIKFHDIYLLGKIRKDVSIDKESMTGNKDQSELDQICQQSGVSEKELISSSLASILEQLKVEIKNIHVRIEFEQNGETVAFGVTIPLIEVIGTEKSKENFLTKKLVIHDLSIYMDTNTEKIQILDEKTNNKQQVVDNFKSTMMNSIYKGNHKNILNNFTFEASLEHSLKATASILNTLFLNTKGFDLLLSRQQYTCFLRIYKEYTEFAKVLYFAPLGRPTILDESEESCEKWFNYAHRCAKKKVDPLNFNIKTAMLFLKNRKSMLQPLQAFLQEKKGKTKEIEKYEKKYGAQVLASLIGYAQKMKELDTIRQLQKKKKIAIKNDSLKINSKDLNQIVSQKRDNFNATSALISGEVAQLNISLYQNDNEPLTTFQINGVSANISLNKESVAIKTFLKSMNLIDNKNFEIFKLDKAASHNSIAFDFIMDNHKKTMLANGQSGSPIINLDIPYFLSLSSFFTDSLDYIMNGSSVPKAKIEKSDLSEVQIQKFIDSKYMMNIDFHMNTPTIIIPSKNENHKIVVETGFIDIKSNRTKPPERNDINSLYDLFEFTINQFTIRLGKENLIKPSSTKVMLKNIICPIKGNINQDIKVDMSSLDLILSQTQYKDILMLVKELQDMIPQQEETTVEAEKEKQKYLTDERKESIKKTVVQELEQTSKQNSGKTPLSKDLAFNADVNFERFSITLLESNSGTPKPQNVFKIENMSTTILAKDGYLDAHFILSQMLCLDKSNDPFFSFGSQEQAAIDISFKMLTDHQIFGLSIYRPFISIEFEWISDIITFFLVDELQSLQSNTTTPKVIEISEPTNNNLTNYDMIIIDKVISQKKSDELLNENVFQANINIIDPTITASIPKLDNSKFIAKFNIQQITLGAKVSQSLKEISFDLAQMSLSTNERPLLEPLSVNFVASLSEAQQLIKFELPQIKLQILDSDYNLILDLIDYIMLNVNLLIPQTSTQENHPAVELIEERPLNSSQTTDAKVNTYDQEKTNEFINNKTKEILTNLVVAFKLSEINICVNKDGNDNLKLVEFQTNNIFFSLNGTKISAGIHNIQLNSLSTKLLAIKCFEIKDNHIILSDDSQFNLSNECISSVISVFGQERKEIFIKPVQQEATSQKQQIVQNNNISQQIHKPTSQNTQTQDLETIIQSFSILNDFLKENSKFTINFGSFFVHVDDFNKDNLLNVTLQSIKGSISLVNNEKLAISILIGPFSLASHYFANYMEENSNNFIQSKDQITITFDVENLFSASPKPSLELNAKQISVIYAQQFILDKVMNCVNGYISLLGEKEDTEENIIQPLSLTIPLRMKLNLEQFNLILLPTYENNSNSLQISVNGINFCNNENCYTDFSGRITSVNSEFFQIQDISADVSILSSNQLPAFSDWFTKNKQQEMEEFLQNYKKQKIELSFVNTIKVDCGVKSIDFTYKESLPSIIMPLANSLIPESSSSDPSAFSLDILIDFNLSQTDIKVLNQKLSISQLLFNMNAKGYKLGVNQIQYNDFNVFQLDLELVPKDNVMICNINNIIGKIDTEDVFSLMDTFLNSEFVTTKLKTSQPKEITQQTQDEQVLNKELETSNAMNIFVVIKDIRFFVTCLPTSQKVAYVSGDLLFSFVNNDIKFSMNHFICGFQDSFDSPTLKPIINNYNIIFQQTSNEFKINVHNTSEIIKISINDIVTAIATAENIIDRLEKIMQKNKALLQTEAETDDEKHIMLQEIDSLIPSRSHNAGNMPTFTFDISVHPIIIQVNYTSGKEKSNINEIPFVSLQLGYLQFELDLNSSKEQIMPISIKQFQLFNTSTQQWDNILSPFNIIISLCLNESTSFFKVDISEVLDFNLSIERILQIIQFVDELNENIQKKEIDVEPSTGIVLKNRTHQEIVISKGKDEFKIANETEFTLPNFDSFSQFTFSFPYIDSSNKLQNLTKTISLADLIYPLQVTKGIICYNGSSTEEKSIIFSSQVYLINHSKESIEIKQKVSLGSYKSVLRLEPNEEKPMHPMLIYQKKEQKFTINDGTDKILFSDFNDKENIEYSTKSGQIFIISTEIESNIKFVTFYDNSLIINKTPAPITVQINNQKLTLNENEEYALSLNEKNFSLVAYFSHLGEQSITGPSQIKLTKKERNYPISVKDQNIVCNVSLSSFKQHILQFFVPVVLSNRTSTDFFIRTKDSQDHTFVKDTDIYLSDESVYKKNNAANIQIQPFLDKNDIADPLETRYTIAPMPYFLKFNDTFVVPLTYKVENYNELTKRAVFQPQTIIENKLQQSISIFPKDFKDGILEIPASSQQELVLCALTNYYVVQIGSNEIIVDLSKPTKKTFLAVNNLKVTLTVHDKKDIIYATFEEKEGLCPIMIRNRTDLTIQYGQKSYPISQQIGPDSYEVYAYNQPFDTNNGIVLIINKESVEVKEGKAQEVFLDDENESSQKKVVIEYISNIKANIVNILYQEKESKIQERSHSIPSLTALFTINEVQISLIDSYRELFLLTLSKIVLGCNSTPIQVAFTLSVGTLTVDDLHPLAVFDNVVTSNDFLNIYVSMNPIYPLFSHFEDVSVKINQIDVYLDNAVLQDVITLAFKYAHKFEKEAKDSEDDNESIQSSEGKQQISNKESETAIKKEEITTLITSDKVSISPIKFSVTHERSTRRPRLFDSPMFVLNLIPCLSNTLLELDPIELTDFVSTPHYVETNIINPMKNRFVTLAMKVMFNVDIMLNIGSVTSSFAKTFNNGQLNYILGGTLRVGENVVSAAGNVVRTITGDSVISGKRNTKIGVNETAGQTVVSGLQSFGEGIVGGVAGIFVDPVRMAQKEGALGFFKGIGTGLTGAITRPTLGVIDAASGIIAGTRKAVEGDSDVHHRKRLSRTILHHKITSFNGNLALCQFNLQMSNIPQDSFNETAELIFNISGYKKYNIAILTQKAIYFFSDTKYETRILYTDIDNFTIDMKNSSLTLSKNASFKIIDENILQTLKFFMSTKINPKA